MTQLETLLQTSNRFMADRIAMRMAGLLRTPVGVRLAGAKYQLHLQKEVPAAEKNAIKLVAAGLRALWKARAAALKAAKEINDGAKPNGRHNPSSSKGQGSVRRLSHIPTRVRHAR